MRRYTLDIRGREFVIDVEELAADRFQVVVGDETYEVALASDEDLPEATITPAFAPSRAAVARAPAAAANGVAQPPRDSAPAARAPARAAVSVKARKPMAGASPTLSAPMPGVILEIQVGVGETVTRGQPIAILEAMKMQNSIKSPRAGTIAEVCVAAGQAVGHGDAIVRFVED